MALFNQENIENCFKTGEPYFHRVKVKGEFYDTCTFYSPDTKNREGLYLCLALLTDIVKVPDLDKKTYKLVMKKCFLCARNKNKEK